MLKKIVILIAVPVVTAILLILFVPSLLSTQIGQHFFLRTLSSQLPVTVTAQHLQIGWIGPQKAELLSIVDPAKGIDVTFKSLLIKESLLSLALKGFSINSIAIDGLNARFENLEALGISPEIINTLGRESILEVRSSGGENNALTATLKSSLTEANVTGYLDENGGIRLAKDPNLTIKKQDPQNQEVFTAHLTIHAPEEPVDIANLLDSSFTGTVTLLSDRQSGPLMTADFELELKRVVSVFSKSQSIKLTMHDSDSSLKFTGKIQDDLITLITPAEMTLDLNALLRQPALAERSPLNLIHSASTPIKVTIAPEGSAIPLDLNKLKLLKIKSVISKLGEITFKQEGPLRSLARHFNAGDKPFTVRFLPAHLSANDGIVTLSRLDLLLMQTYPLALWGTVDLLDEQLRMTLGVPTDALSKFYKLPFLKSQEMVTLPVVGPIRNPKIDMSKFELQLNTLAAKAIGGVVGKLIKSSASLKPTSDPIPPPTTIIPWSHLMKPKGN